MTPLDAPAHTRLFAEFAAALEAGEIMAKVDTPAYRKSRNTIGLIVSDLIGGDTSHDFEVLGCLLRTLARGMKSADVDTRLHAMSEAATLSRMFADYHAAAGNQQDIDDDAEFRANYALPGFEGIAEQLGKLKVTTDEGNA